MIFALIAEYARCDRQRQAETLRNSLSLSLSLNFFKSALKADLDYII